MRWLTVTHTLWWRAAHRTAGIGPLCQGRFKSFPVQSDEYYWQVCQYVERDPLRGEVGAARRARGMVELLAAQVAQRPRTIEGASGIATQLSGLGARTAIAA